MRPDVVVVGAGLAGCEAALQLARRGAVVRLYERKPQTRSAASASDLFAELVCSNSLRGRSPENAVGLLKEEMQRLGSFVMAAALECEVPAGGALAVDRERFAARLTQWVRDETRIEVVTADVEDIPFDAEEVILATGPLTEGALAENLARHTGAEHLHFYDAIAPIIDADSIDRSIAFLASRYDKGGDDYLNLPLSEEEYHELVEGLKQAEKVPPRPFEDPTYFEGCLPVDIMAERGEQTLAYGPLKPVGLIDPRTGKQPHAVVQLRVENADRTAYSLVGFQTRLTHPAQLEVLRKLPGLAKAEFLRLGSVHRNTFIHAPGLVDRHIRLRRDPRLSFAGQVSGVEGYVESAASGLMIGLFTHSRIVRKPLMPPPSETMHGALLDYLVKPNKRFQPSNVTHAMLPSLPPKPRLRKRDRKRAYMERARQALTDWMSEWQVQSIEP